VISQSVHAIPSEPVIPIAILLAYLIGGLPFGYWFVRLYTGRDIRKVGSGNIGATNVHRTAGRKAGLIVLLLDVCKGYFAVWLAAFLTNGNIWAVAFAAVAVMLGHCYPIFLGFKGGKAVACFLGAFLFIAPLSIAVLIPVFFAIVALTKYISLGSILGALLFPLDLWLIGPSPQPVLVAGVFASLLIILRHRANISRLIAGKEHVFSLKGGSSR
jgi:glycerol-3-phosphate acyltransferase PlsY